MFTANSDPLPAQLTMTAYQSIGQQLVYSIGGMTWMSDPFIADEPLTLRLVVSIPFPRILTQLARVVSMTDCVHIDRHR